MTAPLESEALVLRTRDFGEADRIVTLLTPTLGKLSAFARGSRKSTRSFRGGLGVFATLSARLIPRRGDSELARLVSSETLDPHSAIAADLCKIACASYAAELLDLGLQDGQGADLYPTAARFLAWTARETRPAWVVEAGLHRLELLLLDELGLLPDLETCAATHAPLGGAARWVDGVGLVDADTRAARDGVLLSGAAIGWLRGVAAGRFPDADASATRAAVRDALQSVWETTLPRPPRSFAFLRDTLSA